MKTSDYPVWLAVLPDQRDAARAAAGKLPDGRSAIGWSPEDQLWFARPGADLSRLQDWLPDPSRRSGGGDPESEFLDALTDAGLIIDGLPVMDGEIHRVSVTDGPKGNGDGVYRGFLNGSKPGGWFINYWTAKTHKDITKWKATGGESDPVARLHMKAVARQSRDDSARRLAATHAQQTAKAKALYERLPSADPAHVYLQRKGVTADHDIRQTRNGALVVPFQDVNGNFRTLQYIPPNGEKYLFSEAPKAGHFKVVGGSISDGEPILYAEGYATARSLNQATGLPVVMTIDAGNMLNVADILSSHYRTSPHLFMADVDHSKPVNTGLVMAQQAALNTGGKVIIPDFTPAERAAGLTDFNDVHQSRGMEAFRAVLLPQINQALAGLNYKENVMATPDDAHSAPDNPSTTNAPVTSASVPSAADAEVTRILSNPEMRRLNMSDAQKEREFAASPDQLAAVRGEIDREIEARIREQAAPVTPPPAATMEEENATAPSETPLAAERVNATPSPITPSGVENAILVGAPRVAPSDEDVPSASKTSPIDADKLLSRITHEKQADGKSVLYRMDGEPAFIDRGNRLEMAEGASSHEEKVLAALLTASNHYHGRIELTGSDEFKQFTIGVIVANKLDVTMKNASQQADLDAARRAAGQPVSPASPVDSVRGDPDVPRDSQARPVTPTPEPQQWYTESPQHSTAPVTPSHQSVTPQSPQPVTQQPATSAAPEAVTPRISSAVHTPAEKAREPVTGKVTACGTAPFRFETGQSESTFITLRTKEGAQTFWGKELAGLLRETNLKPGRMVTLQWQGEQPVTVQVPQKNDEGVVTHYKSVDTHRNKWSLSPVGGSRVQTGADDMVPLAAVDVNRYTQIQHALVSRIGIDIDAPPKPTDGLYWMKPDGQGSAQPGDQLSAPRPEHNAHAGKPVMSSWGEDGRLDLHLVQGDGDYLQGVVRQHGEYHHVLVSLPGSSEAPPMVVNLLTPDGAQPIGSGNGINRSNGQPVVREHVVVRLTGDVQPRIAKLDMPAEVPAALHARLGYDERYKAEYAAPKDQPVAAPQAAPVTPPRPA